LVRKISESINKSIITFQRPITFAEPLQFIDRTASVAPPHESNQSAKYAQHIVAINGGLASGNFLNITNLEK